MVVLWGTTLLCPANPSYYGMAILIFRDSNRCQTAQSNRLQIPLNEPDGALLGNAVKDFERVKSGVS